MLLLEVWATLPDGERLPVGEIAFGDPDPRGQCEAEFAYLGAWLDHPRAFALDPVHLPLQEGAWHGPALEPPLGVFEDALPDAWGRRLLVQEAGLKRGEQDLGHLLHALGGGGLGALAFTERGRPEPRDPACLRAEMADLVEAAEKYERGEPVDDPVLRRLLAAGGTPGGARPKFLVTDGTTSWIAKLPSVADGIQDVVGLEAAAMRVAREAGLEVPDTELVEIAGRKVLLVRRFDVIGEGGRRHMLSMKALCGERPGRYVTSYGELVEPLRRHAADPDAEVARLYRHMVFNAAIGNTDDHLKNIWVLHDAGWRLSPSFDLVPNVSGNSEHVLNFQYARTPPSRAELEAVGRAWHVADASRVIDHVRFAVDGFQEAAQACDVPEVALDPVLTDQRRRAAKLARRGPAPG